MKKKIIIIILSCIIILGSLPFIINGYIISSTKNQILAIDDLDDISNVDAIMVLGCKVNSNNPSMMLKNRLDMGIIVYDKMNIKLLLSGDHGTKEYDEVNTMRDYVLKSEIDSKNIFLDHAGFSTYDSIYRAKEIFDIKRMIIVTQEYHLYRSLYIANSLGIDAYGVKALDIPYEAIQKKNEVREFLARNKDFFKTIIKPSSKYLGDKIDIKGNGNVTLG